MLSRSVMSDSAIHGLLPATHLCPWGFSRQGYWGGLPSPPPEDLCNPGIEPRSPALQVDSLPSELLGKPKNTGVGSLSLLQGIIPIQELTGSPTLQVDSLPSEPSWKPYMFQTISMNKWMNGHVCYDAKDCNYIVSFNSHTVLIR